MSPPPHERVGRGASHPQRRAASREGLQAAPPAEGEARPPLDVPEEALDDHLLRVVAALEVQGTWVFARHPWDRPPESRLQTRSPAAVDWAVRPWLLTGAWLRHEVAVVLGGASIEPPSAETVADAVEAAGGVQPPADATRFSPGDGSPVGRALALSNLLRQDTGCATSTSLVWFADDHSPRASVWRQDEGGRRLPPPGDVVSLGPAPSGPPDELAPRPPLLLDDEALVDVFARLVIAYRRQQENR